MDEAAQAHTFGPPLQQFSACSEHSYAAARGRPIYRDYRGWRVGVMLPRWTRRDVADDDEMLLVAARHDPEPFGIFYDRHFRQVLTFFYRQTFDPHSASELAAETFACAWDVRERFDPTKASAMSWLLGIAANQHRNWARRGVVSDRARRRWGLATPDLIEEDLEYIEEHVDNGKSRLLLKDVLGRLSPNLRHAVVLRVAFDLPYPDVARELGCSEGAARARVSRALDLLSAGLERADA